MILNLDYTVSDQTLIAGIALDDPPSALVARGSHVLSVLHKCCLVT